MLKYFVAALAFLFFQTGEAYASVDEAIDGAVKPVSDFVSSIIFAKITVMEQKVPLIVLWLLAVGVVTSFYFKFLNIRLFKLSFDLLSGKHQAKDRAGEISNWQALSTSLSATVGLGNIAGVAVAISIGGAGATVWMILAGFLGMSTKFTECALGVKYRRISDTGEVSGGPMYYITDIFAKRNLAGLGRALAIFFAVCCMGGAFGGGNMFQANQTYEMYLRVMGEGSFFADKGWLFGIFLSVLVGVVIIGGLRSIARVSEKIFPTMAILYVLACVFILVMNASLVPDAVATIFGSAFSPASVGGGILGAMVAGIQRAVFSNEAGVGSAAITHAAVKSDSHIAQGLIAMLNPFIDTVIICTMTALVIVTTGVYVGGEGIKGIELTAKAFATAGDWTKYWLGLTVFLFAYSTLVGWYYLGERAFTYLCGDQKGKTLAFKLVYCLFVVIGCAASLSSVVDFTDSLFFAMAIPNIIVLYIALPELKKDLADYLARIKA